MGTQGSLEALEKLQIVSYRAGNGRKRKARGFEIGVREPLARSKNHTYEEVRHCPMVAP